MKKGDLDRAAKIMAGWTLHQMYAEPWWHLTFRCFVPRDKWPEEMNGVTHEKWPECLPDKLVREGVRAGLERARKMMDGGNDDNSAGDQR